MRWADNTLKERYILSMIRKSPLFYAIFLNILFLLLYFAFGQVRHGSLDDYFMSSVLTGAYGGEYDVHMYFVNAAYGYFLKPFYWLFPKAGWYFIFELFGTFLAFSTLSYFVIQRMNNKWGLALSVLILAALTPDFYFQLSFTQCATAYTAAGIVSFSFGLSEEKKKFLVLGGLFLLTGSIMRFEGFLIGLPIFSLLLVIQMYERKRIRLAAVVALCLSFISIWGVKEYDQSLYSEGEYKYYADYQPIRAFFGDGAFYDKESTFDELEERGMSGLDFNLLKAWVFYDTEVFQIDSLKPIKDVAQNNLYKPNPQRVVAAFFLSISNALMRCSGWCWVLLCVMLMFSSSRKANVYPWVSLGFIALCIGYLLLVNRLVYHVESGVWLYAVVSAIPFMSKEMFYPKAELAKHEKFVLLGVLILSVTFAYIGISNQGSLKKKFSLIETPEMTKDWSGFVNYAKTHQDDVFLLSFEQYKALGTIKNPAYKAIEPGSWNNIFSWGYWNIHLPGMREELLKRGVNNPLHDIVYENVYVLEDRGEPFLFAYYPLHYRDSLHVDTVQTFGELLLLKYRVKEDSLWKNGEK